MAQVTKFTQLVMARFRARFEQSGMTLGELGERMGYGREQAKAAAWQFLNSTVDPRLSTVEKLSKALGASIEEFMSEGD